MCSVHKIVLEIFAIVGTASTRASFKVVAKRNSVRRNHVGENANPGLMDACFDCFKLSARPSIIALTIVGLSRLCPIDF